MADTGGADDTKGGTENNGDTVNITPPPSYDQVANAQDTPSEGSRGTTPPLPHSEDDTLPRGHADITPVESAVSIDTMEGRYSKKMDPDYGEKNGVNGYSNNMMGEEAEGEKGKNEEGKDGKKKDEKEPPPPQVGLLEVFRFATGLDWCFMILGTLSACIHGAALPCLMIVFGEMTDSFIADATFDPSMTNITQDGATVTPVEMPDLLGQMSDFAIYYVIIGCAALVFAYGQVTFWLLASFRQTQKIRTTLIQAILRQEVGWFDTHDTGELNTRLSDDVNKIQEGIGDKLGNFFQWISCALAGIIIGFIYGWKMTLVIMATSPLIAGAGGFMTVMTTKASSEELDAYAKAGAVAEEVLGAIRTVTAFGGQKKEYDRYSVHLDDAKKVGIKKSYISGGGMGLTFFIIFAIYALAFWYGSKLVRDGEFTAGRMLIVFFSVLIGAFSVGNAFPNLTNLSTARGAAYSVWDTLNRVPVIDSFSDEGKTPNGIQGNVKFENVTFRYPSRLESPVLNGLSIDVQVGQTVALVGASGCGKSTAIQLLQRFYDPLEGTVYIDGVDVKEYNLQWLRQSIGVVSQEPVLFGVSIEDNIRYGREGVTHAEIEQACKEANAYNFIMELPQKFETLVGERGAQLSGGQKQRIAIARALVRNPKILLLDEATSALDTESEATVQSALDKASQGRTTIVVAHRLSTIKNADIIYGLKDGVAHESGTHDELMAKGATGIYYQLVTNQTAMADSDSLDEDFDVEPSGIKLDRALSHDHPRASFKRGKSTVSAKVETTDEEEDEKLPDPGIMRIMKMNRPEWFVILIGCIASLINGAVQPAFAVIFAEILGVFAKPSLEEQKKETLFFSMMFLVIGVAAGIAMFLQAVMFAISGEKLTLRMRQKMFDCYLKQEISFYDDHRNNTGAVCTRLATDASAIQGATGARLGTMIQNVAALGTGIIIGFVYSWHLTLLIFAFLPFILIGSAIQMKIMQGYAGRKQDALEKAGKVAIEAIENIRTVSSLVKEKYFCREYEELTRGPFKSSMRKAHVYGISFSFTTALIFFAYAACFYLGAYLIRNEGLTFENMFKVFSAIVFGAMAIGQASHFAPDYGKARSSAKRIFSLFDREPAIDVNKEDGDKTPVNGKIEFEAVRFAYPTRDTVTVLKGLDLDISPGQVVALVGSSGCGKSTTVSILERFYDPLEGHVRIDGRELNSYNLHHIRSQMSIVQQEPILFDMSIKDNIAYGDNDRAVPMDEIIQAARNANIHDFIAGLPEGYDTNVGDKGTQLSGGQKQRVAIARALVRNPKILLLDEATSALDTESEKVVQEALDRAQEGRTSIVIAHRLSTIQNADKIYVFHHGKINEEGTHSELLAHKGIYYKLHTAQQRKNKNS